MSWFNNIKHNEVWFNKIAQSYAFHKTTTEAKDEILNLGRFNSSVSGWRGPGLYAHTQKIGKEGKGKEVVYFEYSNLKLSDGSKPEELNQEQWNNLRSKDNRIVDRELVNLGYDGEIDESLGWIRIFPEAVDKIQPLRDI